MSAMTCDQGDSNKPRGATTGVHDEPAVGLAGWKSPRLKLSSFVPMAEGQSPERSRRGPPLPRMKDLNRRSPLCGPLPASFSHRPHPLDVLLITKAKPQFDRAVTERSKPFFHVFRGSNRRQFWPCFPFLLSGRQRVAKI